MFDTAKQFLLDEDRGVSPVIGVILMVAITVILAAVIATFVMNMGPSETTMPNAQWTFDEDGSTVTVEHNGGGAVDGANLRVESDGGDPVTVSGSSEFTAGDSIDVDGDPSSVQVIWENPDSDETQIMAEWEA